MAQASASQAKRTPRIPYASPAEALRFKGVSQRRRDHYPLDLPCHCQAYVDVLTAGRWRALGYYIRPGESACFRAGKRANTPVFCRCQVLHRDTPTDFMADLAPCAACDEPAELDSNGLCADCAPLATVASDMEPEPSSVAAPVPVATPAPTAPVVLAETPVQTILGVPVVRLQLVRDSAVAAPRDITGPADTVTIFRDFIGDPDREHVVMLALSTKNQPVGIATVSIGSLNSSIVHTRDLQDRDSRERGRDHPLPQPSER
jgi:hypothetical protein